jgi:hypothetical protein
VAACAEKTFCENLTIVINERDLFQNEIDFSALGEYLKHVSLHTQLGYRNGEKVGTAEGIDIDGGGFPGAMKITRMSSLRFCTEISIGEFPKSRSISVYVNKRAAEGYRVSLPKIFVQMVVVP